MVHSPKNFEVRKTTLNSIEIVVAVTVVLIDLITHCSAVHSGSTSNSI